MNQEERVGDQAKTWLQENLRIIVSIFIVAAIALGIYSYSQRSQQTVSEEMNPSTTADTGTGTSDDTNVAMPNSPTGSSINQGQNQAMVPADLSKETDTSFLETATRGNGTTHLARRALMNYLEKNPDSSLSGEHKVYIEDYLRKNIGHPGSVRVGNSIEFSKTLINQAIEKSKTLSPKQLQNLKKYSARVAAYRS